MSLPRIHALPLHLANQIAAGEVVERPASVLKELVENSLDAGATQIDIKIKGAGKDLLEIRDNGSGIHKDDLLLALSRHATSKLLSSDDLSHISSLGFRGEALPSIASVSKLTLTSRQADDEHAWLAYGDSEDLHPAAHPVGTTINVAELFFNIPARRHFLRSDKTELHHLTMTLHRLALSRFDVGFNCDWGNQQILRLPALTDKQHYQQRLLKICGKSFINQSVYLEQAFGDIRLNGWISHLQGHRPQTDIQYFFINGRVIRDRVINHAIRQAYGDLLPEGRQAGYVLYLELPLDKVDVNVHPTKHEVRFREGRLIHGLIHQAIVDALSVTPPTETLELNLNSTPTQVNEPAVSYDTAPVIAKPEQTNAAKPIHSHTPAKHNAFQLLHQRYAIVLNSPPKLIDLVQAEQILKRHQLTVAIANHKLASRQILVPVSFKLNQDLVELLKRHHALLEQFAISLSFTDTTVAVQRIPYLLSQVDLKTLIDTLIQCLQKESDLTVKLTEGLINLVPQTPIITSSQAENIISSLTETEIDSNQFSRTLDPQTLSSLFST